MSTRWCEAADVAENKCINAGKCTTTYWDWYLRHISVYISLGEVMVLSALSFEVVRFFSKETCSCMQLYFCGINKAIGSKEIPGLNFWWFLLNGIPVMWMGEIKLSQFIPISYELLWGQRVCRYMHITSEAWMYSDGMRMKGTRYFLIDHFLKSIAAKLGNLNLIALRGSGLKYDALPFYMSRSSLQMCDIP